VVGGGQSQPVDLIEAAALLGREAAQAAAEIDRDGAVSEGLVGRLASAGLMTMGLLPSLGGPGVEVGTMLGAIETLGRGDGSTAWLAMIASTTSILSGYLPSEGARTVFAEGTATISGAVIAPRGTAQRASGGYRVSGRWGFASGCRHASWLGGGTVMSTGSEPDGPPQARIMFFPAEQVTILDTWQVSGLRGSGSHDIVVTFWSPTS
jgi:alkylation response protein AidB-like acyl-CoA dehydrogenase